MKKIVFLGCSMSAGSELVDEDYIKDYWDYKNDANYNKDGSESFLKKFNEHILDLLLNFDSQSHYEEECRKLSFISKLTELYGNDVEIIDYSKGGVGIAYFREIYNISDEDNKFKKDVLDADILIWQLTVENRYWFVTPEEDCFISHDLYNLTNNDHKGWKWQIVKDYYTNIHNPKMYQKEIFNFVDFIILQRTLLKKETIMMAVTDDYHEDIERSIPEYIYYKKTVNKYTKWIPEDNTKTHDFNMIRYLVANNKIDKNNTHTKFNHISRDSHHALFEFFIEYFERENII